jgi:hypothetical protein
VSIEILLHAAEDSCRNPGRIRPFERIANASVSSFSLTNAAARTTWGHEKPFGPLRILSRAASDRVYVCITHSKPHLSEVDIVNEMKILPVKSAVVAILR